MDITAAIARPGAGMFEIAPAHLAAPQTDEILIRVQAVGLCHTDLVFREIAPFGIAAVLGHEGAGIVEQVGRDVTKVRPGDRVALTFRSCGACRRCVEGHPATCEQFVPLNYGGVRADGSACLHEPSGARLASNFFGQSSFATHAIAYERNVVKLDDDIPFDVAAPMGCGFQTGAGSVLNMFHCGPEDRLVIAGGGAVGLSAVMAARLRACREIVLIEPIASRRDLALELGATRVIDPTASPLDSTAAWAGQDRFDFALDTTGRPDILEALLEALAAGGTLGCVGVGSMDARPPGNLNSMITHGHRIVGIVEGDSDPDSFIPTLIRHWRDGGLPFDRLVTRYPFARINDAVADQHAGRCIKVVLTLD